MTLDSREQVMDLLGQSFASGGLQLTYEHRNHPCVRFVESEQQAQQWLQTDTGEPP